MLPLFAYGTLRDPQYQRELFARTFPMQPARVTGFIVLSTAGGYLVATRRPGETVNGTLVDLDDPGYAIADAWEDLSIYDRIEIEADSREGRVQRCFIYVARDPRGVRVADERLADRSRADVVADIRRFRESAAFRDRR